MTPIDSLTFYGCWATVGLLLFIGLYSMLVTRNLLRLLIGVEVLSKACILAIILAGVKIQNIPLAEAIVMSYIIIEVVVVSAGLALALKAYKQNGTLDIWKMNRLRG